MALSGELQNANPTIRNVSELPTRRRAARKAARRTKAVDVGPYEADLDWDDSLEHEAIFGGSGALAECDDQGMEEEDPIDEQEIFGMSFLDFSFFLRHPLPVFPRPRARRPVMR